MVAVLHWEGFCGVACWASFVGPTYATGKGDGAWWRVTMKVVVRHFGLPSVPMAAHWTTHGRPRPNPAIREAAMEDALQEVL